MGFGLEQKLLIFHLALGKAHFMCFGLIECEVYSLAVGTKLVERVRKFRMNGHQIPALSNNACAECQLMVVGTDRSLESNTQL